jgi:RimJ/RimL family protein N-acetyltransferase
VNGPAVVAATDRLLIRELTPADRDAMLAVYGDREAMRWVGDGSTLTPAQADRWLDVTARNYRHYGYGMYAMTLREQPEAVVGFIGLVHPGGQPEAEIKYALGRAYWGAGFATEAVSAVLDYGFGSCRLTRVIATTAPENAASHRVLQKAGLEEVTPRRHDDGSWDRVFAIER